MVGVPQLCSRASDSPGVDRCGRRSLPCRTACFVLVIGIGLWVSACAPSADDGSGPLTQGGGPSASGGSGAAPSFGESNVGSSGTIAGATSAASTATASACASPDEEHFSFFLTSKKALTALAGTVDGFGGDLGGLTGADSICQTIAEKSAACHRGRVVWHAFLSTSAVNAKDRIGKGPWYDRRGRLIATNLTNLLTERPTGADAAIRDDLPNEDGVPNHAPDGVQVDNHEILTGTGTNGNVYTQAASSGGGFPSGGFGSTACGPNGVETWSADAATCWGWTSKDGKGCPRVGHSWPRQGSGVGWISVWNEGGCAPGGVESDTASAGGGLDGTRRVGSAGGYGGFYCFAVTGT
jgi:hypothetical protein